MRALLRAIAVLIAVASVVDPAWSIERPQSSKVVAVDLTQRQADASVAALQAALPGWHIERREGGGDGVPCAVDDRCVVIADGTVDVNVPGDLARTPSLIAIRHDRGPNVALKSAVAPAAHVSAAGVIRVALERIGAVEKTTIVVRDGAAVVGSATHKWSKGTTASIDVPWWPLAAGARSLRIEAAPVAGEAATIDNRLEVGVAVQSSRVPALVFDARPNWNSTFVRRALEDDPRVTVEYRARLAPALTAGTRSGVLDAEMLEGTPVVIVGDPDGLTTADVTLLERFVRVRGGSLILLPERRITGPAARLVVGEWTEHLVPAPERIDGLQASELLRAGDLPVTATVIARSSTAPVIVSLPLGEGRVIVSGAMDAWRYRDANFGAFWRSVVVGAGLAGAALTVNADASLATTGHRVGFTIRHHSIDQQSAIEVKVTARCGDDPPAAVRAWPSGSSGEFIGELLVNHNACELQVAAGGRSAATSVAVQANPARGVQTTLAALERAVVDGGGTAVAVGDEAPLAQQLASGFTPTSRIVSIRPMRAMWWMIPFAGCLAAEWWLRRRDGLR